MENYRNVHRTNFPDLPAWQKLRAELEPHQSPKQASIISYIERIIQSYDDPTARQTTFEQLINWLDVTDLVNNIAFALSPNIPSTSSIEQQAREILLAWLPETIVAFSIQIVKDKKVTREDRSVYYLRRGVNVRERLKNWLYFPALPEWQELQSRLKPYNNNNIDKPLIELVNKAEENYLPLYKFFLYIEAICSWMMQQKKMRKIFGDVDQLWTEARLKNWMKNEFAKKFNPTGEKSATESLRDLVFKYLSNRISYDLIPRELSLDEKKYGDEKDGPSLLDTYVDESEVDLDQEIAALQQAEQAQRGFPFFQAFLKGLVDILEAAYQNCWEVRLANYIDQDPHHELRNTFHVEQACNYQYLLQSLTLPNLQGLTPKTITDICREFPSIGEHSLRSHLRRTFRLWVDSIYLEILTEEEWSKYRYYLENIAGEDLTANYRKGFPTCNIFFLAQHRLPCFTSSPMDWSQLAKVISTSDGNRFRPEYVERFWQEKCRPALGKIARQLLEYKTA